MFLKISNASCYFIYTKEILMKISTCSHYIKIRFLCTNVMTHLFLCLEFIPHTYDLISLPSRPKKNPLFADNRIGRDCAHIANRNIWICSNYL
jgi:hypothetical protein